MPEQRRQKRTNIALNVVLEHPNVGSLNVMSRDMSDSGAFLLTGSIAALRIGDLVRVRSNGLGVNGDELGQFLKMRIVRIEPTGVGLILVEIEGQGRSEPPNASSNIIQLVQQSLLLVFQGQYLLLRSQGDHWRLPSYPVASGSDWRSTLQHSFGDLLNAAGLSLDSNHLNYVDYSYPQTNPHSACMDLLVPAYFWADADNPPLPTASDFAWFTQAELEQLESPTDKAVIDKVLKQGLEIR